MAGLGAVNEGDEPEGQMNDMSTVVALRNVEVKTLSLIKPTLNRNLWAFVTSAAVTVYSIAEQALMPWTMSSLLAWQLAPEGPTRYSAIAVSMPLSPLLQSELRTLLRSVPVVENGPTE
jgi:hypothetical protein